MCEATVLHMYTTDACMAENGPPKGSSGTANLTWACERSHTNTSSSNFQMLVMRQHEDIYAKQLTCIGAGQTRMSVEGRKQTPRSTRGSHTQGHARRGHSLLCAGLNTKNFPMSSRALKREYPGRGIHT